jgi:hypothetical protein
MVIVALHITVEPRERESYLAGCVTVVEQARGPSDEQGAAMLSASVAEYDIAAVWGRRNMRLQHGPR